jgi:hypothetical protein
MPVIPALGKEKDCEFEDSLDYIARSYLKIKKENRKREREKERERERETKNENQLYFRVSHDSYTVFL